MDELADEYDVPKTERLIFHGGWYRDFYYLKGENTLCYSRIFIRTIMWIDKNGNNNYISLWPDFVIKYNPLSADLIEYLVTNIKRGENIFLGNYFKDPDQLLDCEDLIHSFCQIVDYACWDKNYAALIAANYTQGHNSIISLTDEIESYEKYRYPHIWVLYKTGHVYEGSKKRVLSFLNRKLKFLR